MAADPQQYRCWENLFLIFYLDSEIPSVPCSLFWHGSLLNSAVTEEKEGGEEMYPISLTFPQKDCIKIHLHLERALILEC